MKNTEKEYIVRSAGSRNFRDCEVKTQENNLDVTRSNLINRDSSIGVVFIGPSVEGADKEYVKVYSGKVIDKKPSFA
jgi:hypothetical protein